MDFLVSLYELNRMAKKYMCTLELPRLKSSCISLASANCTIWDIRRIVTPTYFRHVIKISIISFSIQTPYTL